MSIVAIAHGSARVVRTTAVVAALIMLVALLAIEAFRSEYGQARPLSVADPVLSAAVQEQESAGLSCSSWPVKTDVVLFQQTVGGRITVVTFDAALAAAQSSTGQVRSYCV